MTSKPPTQKHIRFFQQLDFRELHPHYGGAPFHVCLRPCPGATCWPEEGAQSGQLMLCLSQLNPLSRFPQRLGTSLTHVIQLPKEI